jgi:large exoprotein involved in heme utilization and adhesion
VLRHNSLISTTAGTAQAGGDGGNLNINSQFIVAVPSENSDIRANAFTGKGGEIQIGTQGIFGTQFRPKDTPLSDITASSDFGVSGVVQITTPRVDPSQGLVELPANVVDAEGLIAQDLCRTRGEESAFLVTGRGGLPTNPNEVIAPDAVVVEWANQNPGSSGASSSREKLPTASVPQQNNSSGVINDRSKKVELREAQGWAIAPDGKVILTAEAPKLTPHSPGLTSPGCQSNKD